MKKLISAIVLSCTLLACNDAKSLKAESYVKYMEDGKNNYKLKHTIGDHEYTIQLATPEYMLCKELDNTNASDEAYKNRLKELNTYVFFLIKIGTTEKSRMLQGGNRASVQQLNADKMVAYYDQQAILDISLTKGTKEIKPSTYVFENNYDLSPFNTIVVGFEVGELIEDLAFNFDDRYTDIPAIKAFFDKESLTKLPKLKI